jgi:hypothetical protein
MRNLPRGATTAVAAAGGYAVCTVSAADRT